jgi:hypothetical protein
MTNKKSWLGILVMALVFGMTVMGCGDGHNDEINDRNEKENDDSGIPNIITLHAQSGSGWVSYGSDLKLSKITTSSAEAGYVYKFKIKGKTDKKLKNLNISIFQDQYKDQYNEIGFSMDIEVEDSFEELINVIINYTKIVDPDNENIYLQLRNFDMIPANTSNGTKMATINNFSISFIEKIDFYDYIK